MIFVGERINTGFKDVKQAVLDKDPKPIQEWARKQTDAGKFMTDLPNDNPVNTLSGMYDFPENPSGERLALYVVRSYWTLSAEN